MKRPSTSSFRLWTRATTKNHEELVFYYSLVPIVYGKYFPVTKPKPGVCQSRSPFPDLESSMEECSHYHYHPQSRRLQLFPETLSPRPTKSSPAFLAHAFSGAPHKKCSPLYWYASRAWLVPKVFVYVTHAASTFCRWQESSRDREKTAALSITKQRSEELE